jgi:hypothetical protein
MRSMITRMMEVFAGCDGERDVAIPGDGVAGSIVRS